MLADVSGGKLTLPLQQPTPGPSERKRKSRKSEQEEHLSQAPTCSKDKGQVTPLSVRSRGYVFIVRSGGHVEVFAPIFV